jgi:hypothetical protein
MHKTNTASAGHKLECSDNPDVVSACRHVSMIAILHFISMLQLFRYRCTAIMLAGTGRCDEQLH